MSEYDVVLLALCETQMKGEGYFRTQLGNTVHFSGQKALSRNGVVFVVPGRLVKHHKRKLYTYMYSSSANRYRNQIEYIAVLRSVIAWCELW